MNGYNPKYFNRNFIDSFKKSINESLTQGNRYGIGIKKQVNEANTTSGRESGIGPGKTLLQPDKTWDEVAGEDLDKLIKNPAINPVTGQKNVFAGKTRDQIKLERKDGKVYADGIELTSASTKTSHYAADAPTRAGMAPKPAPANLVPASQGTTTPVKPKDTVMPLTTVRAPAGAPKPTTPAPAAAPKPTAAPAYTGFGSKDWDPGKNPTFVKPAAPVVAPAAPKKAPDKTATPAPVAVTPRPGPDAVRTRGPGSEVTMYRMDQTTMTDKAKDEFAKASQTPAAVRLRGRQDSFGQQPDTPEHSRNILTNPISGTLNNIADLIFGKGNKRISEVPIRQPQINKQQAPREASGAQLGVVGSANQGGTITDAGRAEIEAADRRGREIAARVRAQRAKSAAPKPTYNEWGLSQDDMRQLRQAGQQIKRESGY